LFGPSSIVSDVGPFRVISGGVASDSEIFVSTEPIVKEMVRKLKSSPSLAITVVVELLLVRSTV